MCKRMRLGLDIMFGTDIVGRKTCSCAVLFYKYIAGLIFKQTSDNINHIVGGVSTIKHYKIQDIIYLSVRSNQSSSLLVETK